MLLLFRKLSSKNKKISFDLLIQKNIRSELSTIQTEMEYGILEII